MRPAPRSQDRTVIFLHVPKTAGTTLHHIIQRQYAASAIYTDQFSKEEAVEAFTRLPLERKRAIKMIWGHLSFGLHTYLPGEATYFTFLRDPVERVVSHYHFVRSRPDEFPLPEVIEKDGLGIQEILGRGFIIDIKNVQTRMLAGLPYSFPADGYTHQHLSDAKRNLAKHFEVVGLVERFDESLLLLKHAFGWKNVYYTRHNVSRQRLRRDQISEETVALIRNENALDVELYTYAKKLFAEQLERQNDSFSTEVEKFRFWNSALFGPLIQSRLRIQSSFPYTIIKHAMIKAWSSLGGSTL